MSPDELLSVHLWDLRAQAESKIRCLTRVQQMLAERRQSADPADRAAKRDTILQDLADIISITKSLRSVAQAALAEAKRLS
jgi:hypothetical protein